MKVLYVAPSPKAGTTEHLQPHRAQAMIDAGFAVAAPRIARGAPGWLEEQKEIEAARVATLPPNPNAIVGTQWGVSEYIYTSGTGDRAYITRRDANGVVYGNDRAFSDAPKSILERYYALNKREDPEICAERRIQEANRQIVEQQRQREREACAEGAAVVQYGAGVKRS